MVLPNAERLKLIAEEQEQQEQQEKQEKQEKEQKLDSSMSDGDLDRLAEKLAARLFSEETLGALTAMLSEKLTPSFSISTATGKSKKADANA
jgi:hypothetical protein